MPIKNKTSKKSKTIEFKVNTKVRFISTKGKESLGVITEIKNNKAYVKWDDGLSNQYNMEHIDKNIGIVK